MYNKINLYKAVFVLYFRVFYLLLNRIKMEDHTFSEKNVVSRTAHLTKVSKIVKWTNKKIKL